MRYIFLLLLLNFSCLEVVFARNVSVNLKPGEVNIFSFEIGQNDSLTLHMRGLISGNLACEITAKTSDIVPGEVVFADGSGEIFRDKFSLTNVNGRKIEFAVPYYIFDDLSDYTQAFFYFLNKPNSSASNVFLKCEIEERQLNTVSTPSDRDLERTSILKDLVVKLPDDSLMSLLKSAEYQVPLIKRKAQKDLSIIRKTQDKLAYRFDLLAEIQTIDKTHRDLFRDLLIQYKNIAHPGKNFDRRIFENRDLSEVREKFLQIIPSAKSFLADVLQELQVFKVRELRASELIFAKKIEREISNLTETLIAVPLRLEICIESLEEEIREQLAARLHSISLFMKMQASTEASQCRTNHQRLAKLYERILFNHLEMRSLYILSLLKLVDPSKVSSDTKKLIQASSGLHPFINSEIPARKSADTALDSEFEKESYLYNHFIRPDSVELIPKHQWDRTKTVLVVSQAEREPGSAKTPMPILEWLGSCQFRDFLVPSSVPGASNPTETIKSPKPRKPLGKKSVVKKKSSIPNAGVVASAKTEILILEEPSLPILKNNCPVKKKMVVLPPPIESPGEKQDCKNQSMSVTRPDSIPAISALEEDLKDIEISSEEISSDYEDEEQVFWKQLALTAWDKETKDRYQAYYGLDEAKKDEPLRPSNTPTIDKSFSLSSQSAKTFACINSKIPGVRWERFKTLCERLNIKLHKPNKGSSHRTMHSEGHYLGTVWKPHGIKGANRFGPGQTKLIKGYFEEWKKLSALTRR